jgi:nicotinamide riboside kinase
MANESEVSEDMSKEVLKIVIIGPESTGKSTLCEELAQHYDTPWCPEFAREYLLTYGTDYRYEDLLTIAKGQIAMEEEYTILATQSRKTKQNTLPENPLLFIDTDMYVMKVWCEFVFGKCHQWIIDQIVERKYDLSFFATQISWEKMNSVNTRILRRAKNSSICIRISR